MKSVNPKSPAATELRPDLWMPSPEHQMVPTVALFCGAVRDVDAHQIQLNVRERIRPSFPEEAIRWERIATDEQLTDARVAGILTPFMNEDFVNVLQSRGVLKRSANRTPSPDAQVIVVHRHADGGNAEAARFLQTLGSAITRCANEENARIALILLAIGDGKLELGKQARFAPRFRLSSRTDRRTKVDDKRIFEVCQNLIVACLTSELLDAVQFALREERRSVSWIWVGASAVAADIASMQECVHRRVLLDLISPMLENPPTIVDRQRISEEMDDLVQVLQAENLSSAANLPLVKESWGVALAERSKAIRKTITLDPRAPIRQDILKPLMDLIKELKQYPSEELRDHYEELKGYYAARLQGHYINLRDYLVEGLLGPINQQYRRLSEVFKFYFEPPKDADVFQSPNPSSIDANVVIQPEEVEKQRYRLSATAHSIEATANALSGSPDIVYPGLSYLRYSKEDYLAAVAVEDAEVVYATHLQFHRNARVMLSPLGYLLKLLPAWFLLTGILFGARPLLELIGWIPFLDALGLRQWSDICTALATLLILSMLATADYVQSQNSLRTLWRTFRERVERTAGDSVLRLLYKVLRDYRLLLVTRLNDVAAVLKNLVTLFEKAELECKLRIAEIEGKLQSFDGSEGALYWLADLQVCEQWAEQAGVTIKRAKGLRSVFEHMIPEIISAQVLLNPRRRLPSARYIFNRLYTLVQLAILFESARPRLEFYGEDSEKKRMRITPLHALQILISNVMKDQTLQISSPTPRGQVPDSAIGNEETLVRVYVCDLQDPKRQLKEITSYQPLQFQFHTLNELDLSVLCEKQELLEKGRLWEWLYERAIPLGRGAETKDYAFLTVQHDSIWSVTQSGQYSPQWRGFEIARSRQSHEIGCVRAIVEFG